MAVLVDSTLYFHLHADYIFSQSIKLSDLIHDITFSYSTPDCSLILHFPVVRPMLECVSAVWNSDTFIDVKIVYAFRESS